MKAKLVAKHILLCIALAVGVVLVFTSWSHQTPSQAAESPLTPVADFAGCPFSGEGQPSEFLISVQSDGSWQGWGQSLDATSRKIERKKLSGTSFTDLRYVVLENPCGIGALARPMILEINGLVQGGQAFNLVLPSNPSTGYVWDVDEMASEAVITVGETQLRQLSPNLGGMATQHLTFRGLRSARGTLRLYYRRPWQPDEQGSSIYKIESDRLSLAELAEALSISTPQLDDISAPTQPLQQIVATPSPRELSLTQELPSSFNWCAQGKCTPVRDQGRCGSCWAFSTVGVFESKLLIADSNNQNLSEQFLVSCNTDGYDCDGGWFAHAYHISKLGQLQSEPGAVLESVFPYQASDIPCGRAYDHPHRAVSWAYVNSSVYVPSVAEIKQAIYNHGPVAAAVCVGTAFDNYRGGIFSTDEKAVCGSSMVNHGIILVGWDDSQQVWILRNSWGTLWGEGGYMRIRYGISNVGFRANYLVYNPSSTPTSPAPTTPPPTTPAPPSVNSNLYLPLVLRNAQRGFLLPNGDFEQGHVIWQEYSKNGYAILYNILETVNAAPPYQGVWAAWLGGAPDEISYIQQTVFIPPETPYLSYWHWVDSEDECGYDFGGVLINSTVADVYSLCMDLDTSGWVQHTIDLRQYAGQTVNLQIRAETDSLFNSNLFIDQVIFQATAVSSSIPKPSDSIISFETKAASHLPFLTPSSPLLSEKMFHP